MGVTHAFDTLAGRFGRHDDDSESEINLDALTAEDDDTVMLPRRHRRNWIGLTSALVLIVASVVASRSLFGLGALTSTGLAPSPANLAGAWLAWLAPSASSGANAPWLGLMALGSTIFGGQPAVWSDVLICGGVFLAAWSAYRFVRLFVGPTPARIGIAFLWALILPVTGATGDGSPGWVILAVALPWLASAMVRWAREPVAGLVGLRVPATAALLLALACTVTPALWVAVVIGAIAIALKTRDWRGTLIIAIAPLVVLGPWIPRLLASPGRLLTGVDPCLSSLIPTPEPLGILVGRIGLGATMPLWLSCAVFGVIWLLGFIGIACLPSGRWRAWLLVAMAAAVAVGLVVSRVTVTIDGQVTRAAVLPWLMVAAVIAVGVTAATWPKRTTTVVADTDDTTEELPQLTGRGHRVVVGSIIAAGVALGSFWWLWAGQSQPLTIQSQAVPDYVAASEQSPRATRTLVVVVSDGQASVGLRDANRPTWGSGEQSPIDLDATDSQAVVALAGQFADGFGTDDLAARLGALGIGHVIVSGVPQTSIDAMSGVPDLASGAVGNETIWTVGGQPSRLQLVDSGQTSPVIDGTVPSGASQRLLILLEPNDLPWWASVDGVRLPTSNTATHFLLPTTGGTVQWGLPLMWWAFWWHLGALLVLAWAALPASSGAERQARAEARRAVA